VLVDPRLQSCLDIVLDATKGAGVGARVRRTPQQWSAAEVVEHLQRAYLGTARGLEKAIEKNASLATGATLKQRVASFVLVRLGYFPEGRQAPKHVMPTGEVDLAALVDAVRRDLSRLDAAAIKARERFGRAKVLDHPILGAMTVEEWLKFHQVHTRHHQKQIRARLGPAT
jgi:hypothetical protein